MRFSILGPVEVRLPDGTPVAVGGPRVRALLALLLLEPGRVVGTQRLVDGLWESEPPAGAANALQSQVSRLRQALPGLVERHPGGYRLAVDPDDVDAHRFQRLAGDGRAALARADHATAARLLREALEEWRGPADIPGAHHLDELRLAATEDRIEADLALGRSRELVTELRALTAEHPLRERLRGQLMRALHADGRQAEALAEFDDARRALADQLGIDPSAELASAHLAVLRAEPPAEPRTGLPEQLTSFVGRDDDLTRIGKLLGEARLVTLTGPGGTGKTRLAIEAARHAGTEVAFAELAPVDDPDVPQAVLAALGLRESSLGRPAEPVAPVDRMIAALADRPLLLVLDNCEHVLDAAATLARRLLRACGSLRVLTTSREPLGTTGETLYPVPRLACPPPDTAEVLAYPAVRLFAERAAAVAPEFTVGPDTAAAVRHICTALDGLPLAIELAAARVRSLPVAEIAARLDDRFRLLSKGSRDAEPRHRTLRAVVRWSWDQLGDTERALARRFAVFSGGATLEAVEHVCDLPGEALTDLTEKSLVELGADGRYRMLATVRAFAAEQLGESGERDRLLDAHLHYFDRLTRQAEPHLRGHDQLHWLRRLDAEHDNLHTALRRAIRTDTATALRMLAALSQYWWMRGKKTEGAALAGELLQRLGTRLPAGLEEEYAACVCTAASARTTPGELAAELAVVTDFITSLTESPRLPFLMISWGAAHGVPQDEQVEALMHRQLERSADEWTLALSRLGWGLTRHYRGQLEAAEADFGHAVDGFRSIGDRWGLALALSSLATLVDWRGEHDRALELLDEGLRLTELLDAHEDTADLLGVRGELRLRAGDPAAAQRDYERAEVLARRSGIRESVARTQAGLAATALRRGEPERARELAEAALASCPSGWFASDEARADILVTLGATTLALGDPGAARDWYRGAVDASLEVTNVCGSALAAEGLAGVALAEGDPRRAALLLGAATALRGGTRAGDPHVAAVAADARAALGERACSAAYAEGASMTGDEVVTMLLAEPSARGA